MKTKIFVTGAGGFVASHLIPQLIKNYDLTALVKTSEEKRQLSWNMKMIVADLSQKGSWQKGLKGQDVVIHLAAEISSPNFESFKKNNVVATRNLIQAARLNRVKKIILFSSAAVTSSRQDWYSQTKMAQEEIVKKSRIDYIILRPSMIYGPGDNKNIGWLIKMLFRLPLFPLPGGGHYGRQPVYVRDIVKIVLKLIKGNYHRKIFEIHGFQYVTLREMVKTILKISGRKKPLVYVPSSILIIFFAVIEKISRNPKFTTDQVKSLLSGEKFTGDPWWKTFDIIPTTFESGIETMLKN